MTPPNAFDPAESRPVASLLVELLRFGKLDRGMLREEDRYLLTTGGRPVRTVEMSFSHDDFLRYLGALRPGGRRGGETVSPRAQATVLSELGAKLREFVGQEVVAELESSGGDVQIDLVANARELSALPFEAITDAEGVPLLARPERLIELTRRVRHDFAETRRGWPTRPRVLFVWSEAGGRVPVREHRAALCRALGVLWVPDAAAIQSDLDRGDPRVYDDRSLIEVAHATPQGIAATCDAAARQGRPFTHVHLLAHGRALGGAAGASDPARVRFGLALDGGTASSDQLTQALRGQPHVVTLASCDSGNQADPTLGSYSIAHELHTSGVPVVLASQLPLTVAGSIVLFSGFYEALLRGVDVRRALHHVRVALHQQRATTHADWVSLVAYVRLPEGYAHDLIHVRLQAELASFRRVRSRVDACLEEPAPAAADLDAFGQRLDETLARLEAALPSTVSAELPGTLEEHLGLLASGHKRRAELRFRRDAHGDPASVRQDLMRARDRYRAGFVRNPASHWNGTQFLSLDAVLEGRIRDLDAWHAAVFAARAATQSSAEYWAYGSLFELCLLAPLAGRRALEADSPDQRLQELITRARSHAPDPRAVLESTRDQLLRYRTWWTSTHGFFPGASDLVSAVTPLLHELKAPL